MFVASPYYALCMILGTGVSTLTGKILALNDDAYANGLYGFNGALVGIGLGLFHFGGDSDFFMMP